MKKTLLSAAILSLALAGCSNSEEDSQSVYVPEGTPIKVNALVGEMQTRAGYDKQNAPKGFYLKIDKKKPSKYNYDAWMSYDDATGWSAFDATNTTTPLKMYWAGDGEQVEVTAATFPASEMTTGLAVESDQTSNDNFNNSDKLRMKATPKDPNPDGIEVKLTHLMAKVKLEIDLGEDDDYQTNPLTKVTIGGTELKRTCEETTDGYAFTSLDPAVTGDITPYEDEDEFIPTNKTTSSKTNAKARYEAILVPQTAKAGKFTIGLTLTGGKEFLWTAGADVELKSNYEYTLSLRLYGDKLLLGDVSVDAWGTDKLDGGVVEEYIPWLSLAPDYTLDEAMIKDCLGGSTKLRVTYTLSNSNAQVLGRYSAGKITYLDLADAVVEDGCLDKLSSGSNTGLVSTLETFIMPKTLTNFDISSLRSFTALTNVTMPEGMTNVSLPSGQTITEVTVPAGANTQVNFTGESQLKKVTITGSLTSISDDAFSGCSGLTEINLPSTVTSIGTRAFNGCSSLTEINLPSAVTSIGEYAFYGCSSLTKINLPSTVTSIGDYAFDGCSGLTEINLPSALTTIGEWAFNECGALTEITVPSKVTSLYAGTFYGCTSLKTVNLSEGLTAIGKNAFDECGVLTTINIPSTVTKLSICAFQNCKALTTIDIPSGVTTITSLCFKGCTELTTVTCNGKIGALESNAFMGCTKLTDLYLKGCESLPNLGEGVFDGGSQLITVHLSEDLYSKVTTDNNYAAWTGAGNFTFTAK